jgi:hypothetical protein
VQEIGEALADLLGDICQRTGDVLKGPPAPLRQHSWHDLPEVAADLIAQRDRFAADLRKWEGVAQDIGCFSLSKVQAQKSKIIHAPGCATAEAIMLWRAEMAEQRQSEVMYVLKELTLGVTTACKDVDTVNALMASGR